MIFDSCTNIQIIIKISNGKKRKKINNAPSHRIFPPDIDASYTHHIRIIGEPKEKYRKMVVQA